MLHIYDFTINHVKKPTLVPCHMPIFGWKLQSDKKNVLQQTYQIILEGADGTHFDSGVVEDSTVFGHTIPESALTSRTKYKVTIHVQDDCGENAIYTDEFATEILPEEWGTAKWIRPAEHIAGWAPYLRTKFEVSDVEEAILYATGLGCAEFYINNQKIDDFYVDPPASNYEKIIYYRRWNVTDFLKEGGNAMAVWLGQGFYAQDRVWENDGYGLAYGKECAIARLEIKLKNGEEKVIVTDPRHWMYKNSPISLNNYYGGETYDGRIETTDFACYDGNDAGWQTVVEDDTPKGVLSPCLMPPVRVIRELPAKSVHGTSGEADGTWVFDVGENIAGIAEFSLPHSPKGAIYVFRYGEILNAQGGVDLRSTGAFATQCIPQDIYICRGDAEGEVFRPRFSYHGFRYIEISGIFDYSEGYGMTPKLEMVRALQLSTDFEKTGDFWCENPDWNQLYHIMDNTYRSNYHGFPEDCPAREKCGWLGDAQIVSDFGLLTYDSVSSYIKYLDDIRTSKETYGLWRLIAPGKRCGDIATPLWGCAQIVIPYNIWKYSGNENVIRENFPLMEEWVAYELSISEEYVISTGLGDWEPPGSVRNPNRMPVAHSSTFMFYEICCIMKELCMKFNIGNSAYYGELSSKIKDSIVKKFYNTEDHSYGYIGSDSVAIMLKLVPQEEEECHRKQFLEKLKETDYEMSTGIYANKYMAQIMLEAEQSFELTQILFGRDHESFGTMLDAGATSIWECVSMKAKPPYSGGNVASYNHPMHGGFLHTCYTHLAGIKPLQPGFSVLEFSPYFSDIIGAVVASVDTPFGKVAVKISKDDDGYVCHIQIPTGARMKINPKSNYLIMLDEKKKDCESMIGSGEYTLKYVDMQNKI